MGGMQAGPKGEISLSLEVSKDGGERDQMSGPFVVTENCAISMPLNFICGSRLLIPQGLFRLGHL